MRKILLCGLFGLLAACSSVHPLSQGRQFRLTEVAFSDLKGWRQDNLMEALPALQKSCATAPKDYEDFCEDLEDVETEKDLRKAIEKNLTPYRVTNRGETSGKITGYYEAELTGTRHHENGAQYPIYAAPAGYEKGAKYATRSEIENEGFDAPILAWADNPVDLFIMHVQGSGRMITPEGEVIQLGYAGNNGRTFKGLGAILMDEEIDKKIAGSMPRIREWCLQNPERAAKLMQQNDRYIFFKEIMGEGPIGSGGVALTAKRSLAVDAGFIPMHTPIWLETTTPNGNPVRQLMMAQDTGSAIKGPIRADFFWGYGKEAFQTAGHMHQAGSYYLLLPR